MNYEQRGGPLDPLTPQARTPEEPGQALAALQARRLLVSPPPRGWGGQAAAPICGSTVAAIGVDGGLKIPSSLGP
jgi:hypothetical protein